MKTKLFSSLRPKNKDCTGSPLQVYGGGDPKATLFDKCFAGQASSLLGVDVKANTNHLFCPKVDRNFNGVTKGIAGNASDNVGEFSLCYLLETDMQFFATIGDKADFIDSQRGQAEIPLDVLKGTPLEGTKRLFFGLWPVVIPLFHGMEVPYENINEDGIIDVFEELGEGYGKWAKANAEYRKDQDLIEATIGKLNTDQRVAYLFPAGSKDLWPLAENGNVVDFPFAQSGTHPELASEIRAVFAAAPAPQVSIASPPRAGSSTTNNGRLDGVTIQVRSSEDEDKDAAAVLGQCKLRLFLASANFDWVAGTINTVAYPVISDGMKTVLSKARSARADHFTAFLQMGCDKAKAGSSTSILSKLANIHVVQKTMAASMLLGNFQIAKVDNLYADDTRLDSSAFMGQYDMDAVNRLIQDQQNYDSQNVNNLPETKRSTPKTFIEKIGYLRTVEQFLAMNVNVSNIASFCVDSEAMKAELGNPMVVSLALSFIDLLGPRFTEWTNSTHKGGNHVHLTLYGYFDSAMLRICKFATSFHNINVMGSGRPSSELDLTHLRDAAVCMEHCHKHFTGLFAMNIPDTSPITIKQEPLVPRVVNVPAAAVRAIAAPAAGAPAGAPKRPSPTNQEVNRAPRRLKLATAAPAFDPKEKGFIFLYNPNQEYTFPASIGVCAPFVCQGQQCPCASSDERCNRTHIFRPTNRNKDLVQQITDDLLASGKGWINKDAMRGFRLDPKYDPLLGNKSGPFAGG